MNRARFYALILLISCASSLLYGQEKKMKPGELRGYVFDHLTRKPVEFCTVTVQAENDSTMVKYGMTGSDGEFIIKFLPKKTFRVTVAYIGLQKIERRIELTAERPGADLGKIYLLSENILLDEVKIVQIPPVVFKKDTVEYNAASFFTRPNASVEDLFKRLPGVQVDNEGNIKAFGEGIATVKVDGKVFFGNDPKIATKNLPAEAIEKVQITQEKTEESKNKGIDDGKRVRVINLVLKEDHKTGWFGNTSLEQGTKDRYMGTAAVNHFNHDKQLNFLFSTNNINQIGYSEDNAKAFNNDRIQYANNYYYAEDGSSSSEYGAVRVGNSQRGLTTTHSGGINYGDSWGKKKATELNLSYFLYTDRKSEISEVNRLTFQGTADFSQNSASNSRNRSTRHNLVARFKANPDSLTTLEFTPRIVLNNTFTTYSDQSAFLNLQTGPVSTNVSKNDSRANSEELSATLSVSRGFKKDLGSINLWSNFSFSPYTTGYFENQQNDFLQSDQKMLLINRFTDISYTSKSAYVSLNTSFNLNNKKKLQLNVDNTFSSSTKPDMLLTQNYNPLTGRYDQVIDSITYDQTSVSTRYSPKVGISKSYEKLSFQINPGLEINRISAARNDILGTEKVSRSFINFTPAGSARYDFAQSNSLQFYTYSYTNAPYINYLFRNQNNRSPLYVREVSDNLKASTTINSNLRYYFYSAKTFATLNAAINMSQTFNQASDSTTIDPSSGITRVKMVNTKGESRVDMNVNYNFKAFTEGLWLNPAVFYQTNQRINFLNGLENNSRFFGPAAQLNVSYTFKESLTLGVNHRAGLNYVRNSAQPERNTEYASLNSGANLNYEPLKRWWISADFTHVFIAGQRYMLANAGIQRNFMSKQQLSLELRAFDLFNQNANLVRSVYSNTITDTRSNNLNRYFFLRLNYRINKVGEQ